MPILYNFHILLATFCTIFGTNILIQCLVLVPVCCMFFCFAENPYQPESKRNKNWRRFILEYLWILGSGIIGDGARGGHEVGGAPQGVRRAPDPRGHLEVSLTSTPSLPGLICWENHVPEGFIPFGLRLIFLFFETLKQAKNNNSGLGLRLIG